MKKSTYEFYEENETVKKGSRLKKNNRTLVMWMCVYYLSLYSYRQRGINKRELLIYWENGEPKEKESVPEEGECKSAKEYVEVFLFSEGKKQRLVKVSLSVHSTIQSLSKTFTTFIFCLFLRWVVSIWFPFLPLIMRKTNLRKSQH